jgi:hypothetical protein
MICKKSEMATYGQTRFMSHRWLCQSMLLCLCADMMLYGTVCAEEPATRPTETPALAQAPRKVSDRVIFICDATGSMSKDGRFERAQKELERAIENLDTSIDFNLIFFQDADALAASSKMMAANKANKLQAIEFIKDVQTLRNGNPIAALETAFKLEPSLIYFLSDGDLEPFSEQVIGAIEKLNANKRVVINAVLFITKRDAEENKPKVTAMEKIAADNGGVFRFVTTDDL